MNDAEKRTGPKYWLPTIDRQIKGKEDAIAVLQNELAVLRQKRAELLCPFKVGDRVVDTETGLFTGTVKGIRPVRKQVEVIVFQDGQCPPVSEWPHTSWRLLEARP